MDFERDLLAQDRLAGGDGAPSVGLGFVILGGAGGADESLGMAWGISGFELFAMFLN